MADGSAGLLRSPLPAERVLALDLEMTDIADVRAGRIMEVGVVILGAGLEWLTREAADGATTMYHRVLRLTDAELDASSEWSKLHHSRRRAAAGLSLMELCRVSPFALADVEQELVSLVLEHGQGRPMMLAGSSVACDRVFIDHHMPRLSSVLHHRTIDVSTLLELCRRMYPGFRIPAPRGMQHTALGDIVGSVRLLHYFQNTLFMPMLLRGGVTEPATAAPAPAPAPAPASAPVHGSFYFRARQPHYQQGPFPQGSHPQGPYSGHSQHAAHGASHPVLSSPAGAGTEPLIVRRAPACSDPPEGAAFGSGFASASAATTAAAHHAHVAHHPATAAGSALLSALASHGFPLSRRRA
jgi:oligoribonuclease